MIDTATVPFIDGTAARALAALRDELAQRGVSLLVARSVGQVRDVINTAVPDAKAIPSFASVE